MFYPTSKLNNTKTQATSLLPAAWEVFGTYSSKKLVPVSSEQRQQLPVGWCVSTEVAEQGRAEGSPSSVCCGTV